jgi:hypothetical protein
MSQNWTYSKDPVVNAVIKDAYEKADTGKGNERNTSGTYDLTVKQVQEIMEVWESLDGTPIEPQSRLKDKNNPHDYMLIHLNYKQNSYHVYLKGTQPKGSREAEFLEQWPKANQRIVH